LSWLRTRKRPPQTEVPLRLLRGFAVSGAVMGAIWGGWRLFSLSARRSVRPGAAFFRGCRHDRRRSGDLVEPALGRA
jgi:hypothetical protein